MENNKNLPTLNLDDGKVIATLKATVAKDLTNEEFELFSQICRATGLNPFKREIWAIKGKSYTNKRGEHVEGRLQLMTGINGFYEIANNDPNFDGIETGLIAPNGDLVNQAYPKPDWIGAWARVYLKNRRIPVECCAMRAEYDLSLLEEYYKPNGIWKTKPRIMNMKCAEGLALRKALPQKLNGLYVEEEMPKIFSAPVESVPMISAPAVQPAIAPTNWTYYSGETLSEADFQGFVKFMREKNCIRVLNDLIWKSPVKLRSKKLDALEISEADANQMIAETTDMLAEQEAISHE